MYLKYNTVISFFLFYVYYRLRFHSENVILGYFTLRYYSSIYYYYYLRIKYNIYIIIQFLSRKIFIFRFFFFSTSRINITANLIYYNCCVKNIIPNFLTRDTWILLILFEICVGYIILSNWKILKRWFKLKVLNKNCNLNKYTDYDSIRIIWLYVYAIVIVYNTETDVLKYIFNFSLLSYWNE